MRISVWEGLSEVLPAVMDIWKHCCLSLQTHACSSARQLLFHTFVSICKATADALPDEAFVYVLYSTFPSWSAEFFMSMVCRFGRRHGSKPNFMKLKAMFVCTVRHSFRRELASAKDSLQATSSLSNVSVMLASYYDQKMASATTLGEMIELHTIRADEVCADIAALLFSDEGHGLQPLRAYPDRMPAHDIDVDCVGECFGSFFPCSADAAADAAEASFADQFFVSN